MSVVYVTEHGANIGMDGGSIVIRHKDKGEERIPKETVEGISIFAKAQMTFQCTQYCLDNNVKVSFFTSSGRYLGSNENFSRVNAERIRKQFVFNKDTEWNLMLARKMINAKINNQLVVAKRYIKYMDADPKRELFHLRNSRRKSLEAKSINQLMGYEGISSRVYFDIISRSMPESFVFDKRTRRPARDPINAMLNFGYSMILKENFQQFSVWCKVGKSERTCLKYLMDIAK